MTPRAPHPRAASPARLARRGVTLIELLVVVTLLGIVASVAVLAIPTKRVAPDDTPHRIAGARARALRTGRPVSVTVQLDSTFAVVTAMPDGAVLADPAARVDWLSGQPLAPLDSASRRGRS